MIVTFSYLQTDLKLKAKRDLSFMAKTVHMHLISVAGAGNKMREVALIL